jgi:hypothetical protein
MDTVLYKNLLILVNLINTIETGLSQNIIDDKDGRIKIELEKVKREFQRLKLEACHDLGLTYSDKITLEKYVSREAIISSGQKITFGDWLFRVMPRELLATSYRRYSPKVSLICKDGNETNFPLEEMETFTLTGGPFSLTYVGNEPDKIIIKMIPTETGFEHFEAEFSIAGGVWQKIEVQKEGIELHPDDRYQWNGLIHEFKVE